MTLLFLQTENRLIYVGTDLPVRVVEMLVYDITVLTNRE